MEVQRKKLLSSSRPPILKDIESVRYETIHTSSILPIKDDRSLIFEIPAQKGFYVDMRNIKIHVRYRVTRKNGSQLAGSDGVTPQSAILYSMFRDLQVNFNNRTVFWGKFLYGYYTNLLLQFKIPPNEKTMLQSSIYMYDDNKDLDAVLEGKEVAQMDGTKKTKMVLTSYTGEAELPEWENRTSMHLDSAEQEVMGNVLFDLAFQTRLLRDDINLKFSFTPQNPEFCLLAGKLKSEYTLEIKKAVLQVPRISVRPSAGLPGGDIDYYYVEHRMMTLPIPANTSNFSRTLVSGPLPRRLILCQVDERAYEGDYKKSFLRFPHYDLDSIQVTIGPRRIPADPLTMDWGEGKEVLQAYTAFFQNMKNSLGFSGMPFSREEFKEDRVYFAFDTTTDMEAGSLHWTEGNTGNLSLNMHWKNALVDNIVLILCCEYEMVCRIDKFGQAGIDYAPVY